LGSMLPQYMALSVRFVRQKKNLGHFKARWGNLLRSVPWVSVWHRNMNILTPFTFYLCMLTDILLQYLKIIMCKLPEFFGSQCQDVNFMVCHTLTFFFLNGVSLTQNCNRMFFFHVLLCSCIMMLIKTILLFTVLFHIYMVICPKVSVWHIRFWGK